MSIPHLMLIQSAYQDPGLSARRLRISLNTAIPSLKAQLRKPELRVVVHQDDPHLTERLEAFHGSGCEVRFLVRPGWRLYGEDWELPKGRKLVSRMDDDDVLANDFCLRVRAKAQRAGEWALLWPTGYVFWQGRLYILRRKQNPFVSLLTDAEHDPHEQPHTRFYREWPSEEVTDDPGWIWVRHGDAATPTLPRYRRHLSPGIDRERFACNLPRVAQSIASSGEPPATYAAQRRRDARPQS